MGRDKHNEARKEQFAKMLRATMETPAWRALSVHAQALYPWVKLEWKGPKSNNNGAIQLSVRQAQDLLGCSKDTAAKSFRDLQAKGFLQVTQKAVLGITGTARCNQYELTEIAMPGDKMRPRNLFRKWRQDQDFPVANIRTNNPTGRNGK